MAPSKPATLPALDNAVQTGLLKAGAAIGDDLELNETLKYLEYTWYYLYTNLIAVGTQMCALNDLDEEEIRDKLKEMHLIIGQISYKKEK